MAENIWAEGAEEDIWAYEGDSVSKMEEIA